MDPWELLGLSRDASPQEVKAAYRRLAKAYHPDSAPLSKDAKERMLEINLAYQALKSQEEEGEKERRKEEEAKEKKEGREESREKERTEDAKKAEKEKAEDEEQKPKDKQKRKEEAEEKEEEENTQGAKRQEDPAKKKKRDKGSKRYFFLLLLLLPCFGLLLLFRPSPSSDPPIPSAAPLAQVLSAASNLEVFVGKSVSFPVKGLHTTLTANSSPYFVASISGNVVTIRGQKEGEGRLLLSALPSPMYQGASHEATVHVQRTPQQISMKEYTLLRIREGESATLLIQGDQTPLKVSVKPQQARLHITAQKSENVTQLTLTGEQLGDMQVRIAAPENDYYLRSNILSLAVRICKAPYHRPAPRVPSRIPALNMRYLRDPKNQIRLHRLKLYRRLGLFPRKRPLYLSRLV